ncbi:isoaspartyl peptidase/L-asparaginase family protein [Sanyastnella coralliicola]|uniref:isoaspartyl peptidase/L-asparaginase family protein n=1 Tax=Sanyastnella coralliicola TaxID=3069118 RepID=UPI0027B97B2B|nr:isoaspartyl peptidase/L-asparaginase [Longitalea sp. SCSIO 12813]
MKKTHHPLSFSFSFSFSFLFFLFLFPFLFSCSNDTTSPAAEEPKPQPTQAEWAIAIHGGAGHISRESIDSLTAERYASSLERAISHGILMLENGAESVQVVEEVIRIMEDDSLFNAGKGAVFTSEGRNELDASIMRGSDKNAGAVTGLTQIKNPISAARMVMDSSEHVFFSGEGATQFALQYDLDTVPPSYFRTAKSWNRYKKVKERSLVEKEKMGTVGCVVLDKNGDLAAGTSTGGMTWKKHGRIGDSPMIGAGTYADNETCAVSCTGHGEYFIRTGVAHEISAQMKHGGKTLEAAAHDVIHQQLTEMGGTGGIISVDAQGNISLVFNTTGMFRASASSKKPLEVGIFGDEEE